MKLIICLDERKGMLFDRRRQSRDRLLIKDIESHIGGALLFISAYSEPLFCKSQIHYRVTENPLLAAGETEYCFLEAPLPASKPDALRELVLYNWNRHYPADVFFDMDLQGMQLAEITDFVGSSHEKITKEVWKI